MMGEAEATTESLGTIIRDLRRLSDIRGVVIARRDGLVVSADMPQGVDSRKIAAMTAAIVGASEMAAMELSQGDFFRSVLDCKEGRIICMGAGGEALLVTLSRSEANVGLILLQMGKAAVRIAERLSEEAE